MSRTAVALAVVVLAGPVGPVGPAVAFHDDPLPTSGCPNGRWPFTVSWRPIDVRSGPGPQMAVWREGDDWRLRVTSPRRARTFRGTITSESGFETVVPALAEGTDSVRRDGEDGRKVEFRLRTRRRLDGVNFTVGCSDWLRIGVRVGDDRLPAPSILLGRLGHAYENPVRVDRIP